MPDSLPNSLPDSLLGRHAVVTGAGRGIGAAIARELAARGAMLSLLGRQLGPLESLAEQLPQAHAVLADVSDEVALESAFAQARAHFGPIAILINNAGAAESAPLHKTSTALWQHMLAVNLNGVFFGCRAVLAEMRQADWGRIVNIASTAGLKGYAYVGAYCAAKHGVVGLTRALALELARSPITVNAVCPGYTDTDLVQTALEQISSKTGRTHADALAEFVRANPQQRLIEPQQVAALVSWLCGEQADAITGQAWPVAGGEVM